MKKFLYLIPAILMGCARFSTTQTDTRENTKTGEKTSITTHASALTFFDSRSTLANFKAAQTEKSQGASVGTLTQDAAGTNATALVEAVTKGAVEGAVKFLVPVPK